MPTKKARSNPNRARKSVWYAHDGNEYPIVDLEHGASIYVAVLPVDERKATKRDPNACALVQAWKRTTGASIAQVGCDKAYLPMVRSGKTIALRCKVPKETRDALARFDKTGKIPAEGFRFVGVPPSERMDSQRSQQKRFRDRWGVAAKSTLTKHRPRYQRNASRRAQVFRGK